MSRLITVQNLFSLFLIVWFAYGVWEARSYAFLARIFPFYVSLVLLICAVINFIVENLPRGKRDAAERSQISSSDLSSQWDIPMSHVWRRFLFFLGIILSLYAATFIIGYPLAVTLFIFLFYRKIARASYAASLVAGGASLGFLALASTVLHMSWPEGLIHLPWPLG